MASEQAFEEAFGRCPTSLGLEIQVNEFTILAARLVDEPQHLALPFPG
jgi:hypothetical protein